MFKVNIKTPEQQSERCSKLAIEAAERHHLCPSDVYIVNFEHMILSLYGKIPVREIPIPSIFYVVIAEYLNNF